MIKIGDKIKLKFLSEEEFKNIYSEYFSYPYHRYKTNRYSHAKDKIFKITSYLDRHKWIGLNMDENTEWELMHGEIIKVSNFKQKIKFVKDLLK